MKKISSEGKCLFCDRTFKKAGINRHLAKHLVNKAAQGKPGKSYHLKVGTDSSWGNTPYFLPVWMDSGTSMKYLDDLLRGIWLECCGHLSSFVKPMKLSEYGMFDFFEAEELYESGKIKEYEDLLERSRGEIPMHRSAGETYYKDLKLQYQYDFGSTTALEITVMDEYPIKADKPIVLLSRNEPLNMLCDTCNKQQATSICTQCYGYEDQAVFCEKCANKHTKTCEGFADYANAPVVNSPRMGVCGYRGGTIDVKRDGILNITL